LIHIAKATKTAATRELDALSSCKLPLARVIEAELLTNFGHLAHAISTPLM